MLSGGLFRPGSIAAGLCHEIGREAYRLSVDDHVGVLNADPDERDKWADLSLAGAALCYSLSWDQLSTLKIVDRDGVEFEPLYQFWPIEWDLDGFVALERRASLIRAAALLLLEVARLDAEGAPVVTGEPQGVQ